MGQKLFGCDFALKLRVPFERPHDFQFDAVSVNSQSLAELHQLASIHASWVLVVNVAHLAESALLEELNHEKHHPDFFRVNLGSIAEEKMVVQKQPVQRS